MKKKDLMEMSEPELADEIDNYLTDQIEKYGYHKECTPIRTAFRMLQLQLNFIKARADLAHYFSIAILKNLPKEQQKKIMNEINCLKEADNEKIKKENL